MSNCRWLIVAGIFPGALSLAACTLGVSGEEQENGRHHRTESKASANLAGYSTRELARGILLLDGPVADEIPSIRDSMRLSTQVSDPQQLKRVRAVIDETLDELEKKEAAALERFRTELLSGDHVRIQQAVQDLRTRLPSIAGDEATSIDDGRGLAAVLVCDMEASCGSILPGAATDTGTSVMSYTWVGAGNIWGDQGDPQHNDGTDAQGQYLLADRIVADIADMTVPFWQWQRKFQPGSNGQLGYFYTTYGPGAMSSGTDYALALGDLDCDGVKDRIYYQARVNVANPNETATVHTRKTRAADYNRAMRRGSVPVIGDFDGNGCEDILWRQTNHVQSVWYHTNVSSGVPLAIVAPTVFAADGTSFRSHADGSSFRTAVGDFNGDAIKDVFWYGLGSAADDVWFGRANAQSFRAGVVPAVGGFHEPISGDFMPGANDDIFFYSAGGTSHTMWQTAALPSNGVTLQQTSWTLGTDSRNFRISVFDSDRNGKDDMYMYTPHTPENDDALAQFRGNDSAMDVFSVNNLYFGMMRAASGGGYYPVSGRINNDPYPTTIWWLNAPPAYPL